MLEYYRFRTVHDLFVKGLTDEARMELAELQHRYVLLCDENASLKMQVQEYEDALYLARNLTFDGNFYWLTTGSIRQGPFCPSCYDRDGLLMRLSGEAGERYCPACREQFFDALREPMAVAVPQEPEISRMPPAPALRKAKRIPFVR